MTLTSDVHANLYPHRGTKKRLDFTKKSIYRGKLGNCKYVLLKLKNMIQLNIFFCFWLRFISFYSEKKAKNTHFYSKNGLTTCYFRRPYLITIITDCHLTLTKMYIKDK